MHEMTQRTAFIKSDPCAKTKPFLADFVRESRAPR